ncbi:DsbA family protein [Hoeflea alexandrii]|jgi:protein-disulfide isomerase|uniref:DsbA family protein n=1 Tax=Hoeflea alexandrii TaxID=288436 RepID=UPI0022AFB28B|nr:thioredoxin domain-containing protein [Hoeflea alexandrii]MCZ4292082.1 thioredoxin domain-containing protein [Hoeflea alexandrii]|tara:strand:- start:1980 stop:2639 length:660 start_codon:yes stop_codon:yes gene_type:complete
MNRRTLLIGASALGLAAFGGGAFLLTGRQQLAEAEAVAVTPAIDKAQLIRDYSPSFGPDEAPVTLVEFFDPSCEACRAFHPAVQAIREEFPEQVRVVMRYTVFHEGSDEAVRILETARMQDKFEPVLDAILKQQPTWAVHGAPRMDLAWQIAAAAGLDLERAKSDRLFPGITAILNQDKADVEAVGIRQTPTFFLNGRELSEPSLDGLIAEVRRAVENS